MKRISLLGMILLCCSIYAAPAFSVNSRDDIDTEGMKAPPRNVKDILKIIEQSKQNTIVEDKAKKIIGLSSPSTDDKQVLNSFYYRRAIAYEVLGNSKEAAETLNKLINEYPSQDQTEAVEELFTYSTQEALRGNYLGANKSLEKALAITPESSRGWRVSISRQLSLNCASIGDFECAQNWLDKLEGYLSALSNARPTKFQYRLNWEVSYEWTRATLFLQEGKFLEAERSFRQALKNNKVILESVEDAGKDALDNEKRILQDSSTSAKGAYGTRIALLNGLAKSFLGQRRLNDAEFYAREALTLSIDRFGVNSTRTVGSLLSLTRVVSEQGRQAEAVLLASKTLKIAQQTSNFPGSPLMAEVRRVLGGALVADGKYDQAEKVFNEMVEGVKSDPVIANKYQSGDLDWALALIKTNKAPQALNMMSDMLAKQGARFDKNSPRLAMLKSFNAVALQASGQNAQALNQFKESIPILINQARNDTENATESVRQVQRMTFVLEGYLASLAQQAKSDPSGATAAEAFQIADLARGSGVQRALTSSAARANITDPQLATLARKEQDLQQRINTLSELLVGLLSAPPADQLPSVQAKIRADISNFKSQREDLKKELERKFPDYAELVDPKPASVERTQKALKSDEVLVSWYFADNVGYVWAITKDKPAQFAQLSIGRLQMSKEVSQLRKALDPGVATIDEIPAFDVTLANQLYQQTLAPVQSAFSGKKVMLTVPHAELGQLPSSLLVTKPVPQPAKGGGTPFIAYKNVPWLTREIAVAQVPSVTALTALRSLPPGSDSRKNFVGFGDPYFSLDQERQAEKQLKSNQLATRGKPLNLRSAPKTGGISSAELALLPRLPDTSSEIEEIAKVEGAGPEDIFLNQRASVQQVTTMDLSNRKVIMFATHGLVPGDLNGLTQPALALSSPEVTGNKDDGLLTMDKVIALKLNADWVVLSACNTAAGEGAGSEAVSGLGRAFFFAGTRALLVSNWPVDSVASRNLMTDLFKRQQQTKGASKAELLRQAMLEQIDNGGSKEGGSMKYSYAHPLFWAPFVVVGD